MITDKESRRAGWQLMRDAVRPQTSWVVAGVSAGVVWTAAKVAVPLLAATAIDDGILRHNGHRLVVSTVAILLIGVVQAVSTGVRRYCAFRLALRTETNLRERLFAHLQRLHFAFHDQAQTGQLMANANTDLQQIETVVILIPLTIASSLTLVAVVIIIVMKSLTLALLALASLPFLNVAAVWFTKRMQPVGLALQEELADLAAVVEESVSGVRVVKGFGAERMQVRRLQQEAGDVFDRSIDAARLRAWFLPLVDFVPTLSLVAILWYGGHLVLNHDLQLGYLVAFNSYILMLIWPLRMLGMLLGQASRSSAAAGRIDAILETDVAVASRPGAAELAAGSGELRFEGVRFGYARGRAVLDQLDLVIRAGEAVALVGSTGCGKTTVARLVPRFYDVDAGRVVLDGADVRDIELRSLRRAVGIVFEDTFLFSDTVRENIAFADPGAPIEAVRRAACLAGADEFIAHLPHGYDTIIGEHGYSLSGGQRQRIAIARAVLANPRVLILDDATSSVDPTKEHEIRTALREVMDGRTTLIIAHRPATIALADRVVLLDQGRVVAQGTHDELLATSAHYREVLAQSEGLTDAPESVA